MPQSNIYALLSVGSFIGAWLSAKIWTRVVQGELPGGAMWAVYLRVLVGFLLAAGIVFGYRAFQ